MPSWTSFGNTSRRTAPPCEVAPRWPPRPLLQKDDSDPDSQSAGSARLGRGVRPRLGGTDGRLRTSGLAAADARPGLPGGPDTCTLLGADGQFRARLDPKLFTGGALDETGQPSVGDWAVTTLDPGTEGDRVVLGLLPRRTAFVRRATGRETAGQVVAANIDTVFIVSPLSHKQQLRRLERFLRKPRCRGQRPRMCAVLPLRPSRWRKRWLLAVQCDQPPCSRIPATTDFPHVRRGTTAQAAESASTRTSPLPPHASGPGESRAGRPSPASETASQ